MKALRAIVFFVTMTIRELYQYLQKALGGKPFPSDDERRIYVRRVFEYISESAYQDVVMHPDRVVDSSTTAIDAIVERLIANEPLEYVFNSAQFLDLELFTNGNVLIPRPETEELVLRIAEYVRNTKPDARILDIGTGSGCIPIYLGSKLPSAELSAFDISDSALATARQNAGKYGVRIDFHKVDILDWEEYRSNGAEWQDGKFDVIVSNPPYVLDSEKALMDANVLDFEPHNALFVPDSDPLLFYRRISGFASEFLNPGGMLFFEINERFAEKTATLMRDCGFGNIEIIKDLFMKDRFVMGEWPSSGRI